MAAGTGSDRDHLVTLDALDRVPLLRDADDAVRGVVVLTVVGLCLRLLALGARVAHFDEGRVAYFTTYFMQTGNFEYRSIIHGPFLQHVNTAFFSVLGPTDFASRLVVALVGAALPLTALAFRRHLRDTEVVAFAFFLALNPIILYYSRFSRSSVLVAAFMFGTFALFVRALDTHDVRLVYAGAFLAALGFTAKENAILYVLCWLGAGFLVADRALFGPREGSGFDRLRGFGSDLRDRYDGGDVVMAASHAVLATALFVLVVLFFYAPRGTGSPVTVGGQPVGLYGLLSHPGAIGDVLAATLADIEKIGYWVTQAGSDGGESAAVSTVIGKFWNFFKQSLETYALYAAPLAAFGVLGFLVERYASSEPRPLVMFAGYWAFASAIGYPLGTDIYGAWITVNVLVPLAIPAAVALAMLYRAGVEAFAEDDRASVGLVALIGLLVVGQVAVASANGVYLNADEADGLAQYAQPSDETRVALEAVAAEAAEPGGPDLLVYGSAYADDDRDFVGLGNDDIRVPLRPHCVKFFPTLSLPWYFYKDEVETVCATNQTAFESRFADGAPPVVIAPNEEAAFLDGALGDGYERSTFYLRTAAGDRKETVVYVRE
jgi:uncharacterized protein (TIGR03663 family)